MGWSKQKLEELLVGLLVDMSAVQGNAKVTALKDLKGEVRPGSAFVRPGFAFVLVMHGTAYRSMLYSKDFFSTIMSTCQSAVHEGLSCF